MRLHTGILLLDKPIGVSSAGAVRAVETRLRWVKCGHIGTLDPQASGLLVVLVGSSVKMAPYYLHGVKRYTAAVQFGTQTDSYDSEGSVVAQLPVPFDLEIRLRSALERMLGSQEQIPPVFSAIKQGGRRLYELARKGLPVEAEPRRVFFNELSLLRLDGAVASIDVACSSGTYIRSLAYDLGLACGTCAFLSGLRRTGSAPFDVASAIPLERLHDSSFDLEAAILPIEAYPPPGRTLVLGDSVALKVLSGKAVAHPEGIGEPGAPWVLYSEAKELIAMAETSACGKELLIRRVVRLDVELPNAT